MDKLNKDILFLIALELDLQSLLNLCDTYSRVNELICEKNAFWLTKLNQEFPNWKDFKINKNYQNIYKILDGVKKQKDKYNMEESLLEVYEMFT